MKRMVRKTALFLVFVMLTGLFAGCSSLPQFDASKYLQAMLDAAYKNDATLAEELKLATKEEVEQQYNQTIDDTIAAMFGSGGFNASEDLKERYRKIYADIFSKMDYTVKDSRKLSDGSYSVTVTYKQMKLFKPAMKKVRKNLNKVSNTNAQLALESMFTVVADSLEKSLSRDLKYGTEEVMVVHIEIQNHMYVLKKEDAMALTLNLIDEEEVLNSGR